MKLFEQKFPKNDIEFIWYGFGNPNLTVHASLMTVCHFGPKIGLM